MVTRRARLACLLAAALWPRLAAAHWCDDLWGTSYNIVVRPVNETVTIPSSGAGTLEVFVQNNMGYPLESFVLDIVFDGASGYSYTSTRQAPKVPGYLMPGEKIKYTFQISKSGGGTLSVDAVPFGVQFGTGRSGQSWQYPRGNGYAVMIKHLDGTLFPTPVAPDLGSPVTSWANDQAYHLAWSAVTDYGNLDTGLNGLLQEYCAGRGSWDHSNSNVLSTYCSDVASTSCPARQSATDGSKYDWQKLWAAQELAYRKSALGARLATFRARLACGLADGNPGFGYFAMFALGYLGEDATARSTLAGVINSTASGITANDKLAAKAALLMFGATADRDAYYSEVSAGMLSADPYVAGICAAAISYLDKTDGPVIQILLPRAQWIEPDTSDNGAAFYASHLLALLAWDRRGWQASAGDTGVASFYSSDTVRPAAPSNPTCTPTSTDGQVRIAWNPVTLDINGQPESVTQYRVYSGTAARPGGATEPGAGGFDYAHVDTTSGTTLDVSSLPGGSTHYFAVTAVDAATNASLYSVEVSCIPPYRPVAAVSCDVTDGSVPLTVNCNSNGSTDANGAGDIVSRSFSLDGAAPVAGATFTHTFSTAGQHTLTATVTDSTGRSSTASVSIIARDGTATPPIAVANASPTSGQMPLTVQFDSTGTTDDAGETLTYSWNFRDGTAASPAQNPLHVFTDAGVYDVLLTVTDNAANPSSGYATVTIDVWGNSAPDAGAAWASPLVGAVPLAVHFDGTGVTDPEGNGIVLTWDFGDGSGTATGATADHTYTMRGTYTATLSAQDDGVPAVGPATRTFTISPGAGENRPPDCASATVTPANGVAPLHVVLDATGCTDPDNNGITYAWRIPTSMTTQDTFNTARVEYTVQQPGNYQITLTAADNAPAPLEITRTFSVSAAGEIVGRCGCAEGAAGPALLGALALALALRRRQKA